MPTARDGLGVGVLNGVVYAIGGASPRLGIYSTLGSAEVFDPVTNSCTTKAPMPTSRGDLGAAVANGVLYAVGGYNQTNGVLTTVEAYAQ
jgi:hypothetical protein